MNTVMLNRPVRSAELQETGLRYGRRYLLFLAASVIQLSANSSAALAAGLPPPSVPEVFGSPASNHVPKKPSVGLHMGAFKLVFEKTTIDEMLQQVGSGVMHAQGDAGEAIAWLCYTVRPLKERIWIIASAEMGGPEHRITNISASYANGVPTQDCPELPNRLMPLSLDKGIWLGMAADDANRVFAVDAGHVTGDWATFEFEGHAPADVQDPSMCASTGYDVENWLVLKQRDRRIVELHAGQTTTC
jgi:hypothetical protein